MCSVIQCTIFVVLVFINSAIAVPSIESKVFEEILSKGSTTVILHFKGPSTSSLLSQYQQDYSPFTRSVSHDILPNMLERNANENQAETLKFLEGRKLSKRSGSDYFQLWMFNQVVAKNADQNFLEELSNSTEITKIEADETIQAIEDFTTAADNMSNASTQADIQWGVKDIGAPEVWAKGRNGQGVTVGVIDSGIRCSHQILNSRCRSSFGWHDAVNEKPTPYDDYGHGTHVAGIIAGTNGYGVAPGATLIGCKALKSTGAGQLSYFKACAQFMLCPTEGRYNRDCSKKPKVINNSWGEPRATDTYKDMVNTWTNAGIIPIFSAGNLGICNGIFSPADYDNVITIGSYDSTNRVYPQSSKGPIKDKTGVKPDVVAPGANIQSASHTSDTGYKAMTGTSQAAPHASGAAALYLSANPNLSFDNIRRKLRTGNKPLIASGENCGNKDDRQYPNFVAGYGKIYAPAGM